MNTQHTTPNATVKEMQTLTNTCKKYADDTATHWQQVHNLTAAAHSAANRANYGALDAESAANRAATCARTSKIYLMLNIITTLLTTTLAITLFLTK